MWAACGISGRSTGTSCAALTFSTAITCVMSSSEPGCTRSGRSMLGIWRALASGTISDDAAGFHGHELVHLQQRQEGLVEGIRASSGSATAS